LALRWLGLGAVRRDFTYGQLADASSRCAGLLRGLGLAAEEVVGVMVGRRPETLIAALGIWKAGGVYCPLFADLGPDPLQARLDLGDVRILIVTVEAYAHGVAAIRASLPKLRAVLVVDGEIPAGCLGFQAGLAAATPAPLDVVVAPGRPVVMHFTSGTTAPVAGGGARPKAVVHDSALAVAAAESAKAAFGLVQDEMIWCAGEPGWVVHSIYGLIAPLALGASVLLDQAPPTPTRCLSVLEDEPVALWYTSPTIIRGLIGGGIALAREFRPRALRLAASVGEPLSADAVEWGRRALGVAFRDTWWQTETGTVILAHDPAAPPRAGSMGRPLPGAEVQLVHRRPSKLDLVPAEGEASGELAVRSSCLPAWRSLGGEGGALPEELGAWHLSGDFVRRDADGYFWFLGREDEVIKSGSRMVGPFEIEAVLMSHPAVAEVGVIGAPDVALHERVVAFVALNPGFEGGYPLQRELLDFAREHLGEALAPHEILFEQDMPRTPSGKIVRRALKPLLDRSTPYVHG